MNLEKITGFVLLIGGIVLILYSLYSSAQIFSGNRTAPEIFSFPQQPKSTPLESPSGKIAPGVNPEILQQEFQSIVSDQLKTLLPPEVFPKTLNLFSWSMFAGLLMLGGSQIAGIGIKLLKQ